jgi:hypothetical protein
MSTLRTQMTQDMIVRGLDKTTQHAYLHAVTELSAYYHRRPDTLRDSKIIKHPEQPVEEG